MILESIRPLKDLSEDQLALLDKLLDAQPALQKGSLVVYEVCERPSGNRVQIVGPACRDLKPGDYVLPQGFHRTLRHIGSDGSAFAVSLAPRLAVVDDDL